jgi:hypothetical protein
MINRTRCLFYEVQGVFYKDLVEAQKADLAALIPANFFAELGTHSTDILTDWLLKNGEDIARILTTTPKSRNRKPRKDKGVPRKRSVEAPVTA